MPSLPGAGTETTPTNPVTGNSRSGPKERADERTGVRLGLCCQFAAEPIRFRTTTVASLLRLSTLQRREKLAGLCLANAHSLLEALKFCQASGIGCFRVNSQILPAKTHADAGYSIDELPGWREIVSAFGACGTWARQHGIRTVFHPDQFVVLNSPRPDVVDNAIRELEYQAEVAGWIGADVINVHGGGAYGDRQAALDRWAAVADGLPESIRKLLTVENDDRIFSPADLLPLSEKTGVPLVYDVHHHRCLPDDLSIEEATRRAIETWDREPLFHVSSPQQGWTGQNPSRHHDYISLSDFPECWLTAGVTVEVEARSKELAVLRLRDQLNALRQHDSGFSGKKSRVARRKR